MTRVERAATAIVMALMFSAVSIVADWCAISCAAARSTASAAPACHHTGPSALRVGHVPTPCGQDHHPVVIDAAMATAATTLRIAITIPAPVPLLASATAGVAMTDRAGPGFGPPAASFPLALSSALRI